MKKQVSKVLYLLIPITCTYGIFYIINSKQTKFTKTINYEVKAGSQLVYDIISEPRLLERWLYTPNRIDFKSLNKKPHVDKEDYYLTNYEIAGIPATLKYKKIGGRVSIVNNETVSYVKIEII